jgi:Translationally controlled tumour protein
MKAVKAHLQETNPDRIPAFEKGAAAFAKQVVGNFKDYEFYTGSSMNPDGWVAVCRCLCAGAFLLTCAFIQHGRPPQLPRGRRHTLFHLLEGRAQGREDLKQGSAFLWVNLSKNALRSSPSAMQFFSGLGLHSRCQTADICFLPDAFLAVLLPITQNPHPIPDPRASGLSHP